MRKLSKKISVLMVLAMLVSMFSGIVSASAASAWSFKSKNYNVAVGGTIVMGNKEYADFDLLKDGKAPTGYTVTWASSDENVVWVNAKTGQLRANKLGMANIGDKATISATFTNTKTGKSATRSFVIAYGTPEYKLVTKIGDVEVGKETLAVGSSYKLATTVLDADGNSVDFKTCKLYRNYFVDGKAIANPYVPEKEGEVTIVVAAFTKKADMTDLSKAVQTKEYKVTATTGAFSAEATGLKEITVYGEFAKNSTFSVKKDGAVKISATATIAADGKSAKLALANRLTKGVYTVSCGKSSVDIACEDEYPAKIVIEEAESKVVTTSADRLSAFAHYDVFNQYNESIRRSCSVKITGSVSENNIAWDSKTGLITMTNDDSKTFVYGSPVVLNITANGYAAFVSATMTIGLENSVNAVDVIGVTLANSGKVLKEAPVSLLGAKDADASSPETAFYLLFTMLDRAGHPIKYSSTAAADITITSFDPLLIQSFGAVESKVVEGTEYAAVQIYPGLHLKKGGVAKIKISSNKTGNSTDYELRIVSDQILKEFTILPQSDIIVKDKTDGGATEVELKYEAIDTNGEKITDFRALYDRVSFSNPYVRLTEQNDGTAKLTYTVEPTVNPTKDYDFPVVVNAVVPEGKGNNVTLRIKEARFANSVEAYHGTKTILEGQSLNIDLGSNQSWVNPRVQVYDQYDAVIAKIAKFYNPTRARLYTAEGFAVRILTNAAGLTVSGNSDTFLTSEGETVYYFPYGSNLTLTADKEVTDNYKDFIVEFALAYAVGGTEKYRFVSGSAKTETISVADITQASSFSLGFNDGLLENNVDDATLGVKATFTNGDSANLDGNVVEGTQKYMLFFKTDAKVYATADATSMTTVAASGSALATKLDPAFMDEKLEKLTFGTASQFENPAVINPDGTYGKRNVVVNGTAIIYIGEYDEATDTYVNYVERDVVKTTAQVGGYKRLCETIVPTWMVSNGASTINANNTVITYADLMARIDKIVDNYGEDTAAGNNMPTRGTKAHKEDTIVTITNVKEDNVNGLKYNNFKVVKNAQALASNNTLKMIEGAEIGDTFIVTYTSFDSAATLVIKFTVGADNNAYIGANNGFVQTYPSVNWY